MTDVEIGRGKSGRRAYSLSEIGIVPARRTRDPEEVSIAWQIDAYRFDLPLMASPMDSVVSPETAIAIGRLGGLAVLDVEGLWTRYEDPEPLLAEVTELDEQAATRRLQAMYAEPISEELIGRRIEEIARAGVTTAASLSPQRTARYYKAVVDAGVDIFVIRGTTVSAEHVSGRAEPLNLKQFIYELDVPVVVGGCATYAAALHLMRTGAAGVLVVASTRSTLPRLPLCLAGDDDDGVAFANVQDSPSQNLRRERDDLHERLRAELAGDRAKDAGSDRLVVLVDEHGASCRRTGCSCRRREHLALGADDDRLGDLALLHLGVRDRLLDRDDDDVADRGVLAGCEPPSTLMQIDFLGAASCRRRRAWRSSGS